MAPANGRFLKLKSALSDTPEIQEIRRVIRVLREESERKLQQDAEVYDAIAKLNNQVHVLSDNVASLSDAFMKEGASQGSRICEMEDRIRNISERLISSTQATECQLMQAKEEIEAGLANGIRETKAHVISVGTAHKDALQRFQEDVYSEISSLSNATTAKMAEMADDTKRLLGNVRADAENEAGELSSEHAALKESYRQGNALLMKQLASLVRDIAQLTDSYEALKGSTQEEAAQIKQIHKEHQRQQDQLSTDVQQLQLQLKHSVQESSLSSRTSVDELRTTISEVKQQLSAQQQLADLRSQQLQERLQQQEKAAKTAEEEITAEHTRMQKLLEDCTTEAQKMAEDIKESLQQDIEEAVRKASTSLEKVRSNVVQRLLAVEEEVAETKKSRESDLEIIERALVVSHSNHEKSDKVLQNTIATMKELEGRCTATAQQGDLMAERIEEVQHRLGIIQQAMLPPKLGNAVMPSDQDVLG